LKNEINRNNKIMEKLKVKVSRFFPDFCPHFFLFRSKSLKQRIWS
jgi:hypothetical protein